MEDVSKVIEIAVGIIIFILAVTIAIMMYNKLYKATENTLYINNIEDNVMYNYDGINEYVYNYQDIYFLLKSISESKSDEVNPDNIYSKMGIGSIILNGIASNYSDIDTVINTFKSTDKTYKYKVTYEYDVIINDDMMNLNSHLPTKVIITKQ